MPFNIGLPEMAIILVIVLLVFGANRLPQVGNALGKSIREFKRGMAGEEERPTPPAATAAQLPPPEAAQSTSQPGSTPRES